MAQYNVLWVFEPFDLPMKYWSFITYSHKDRRRARKLHRNLEAYPVPKRLVGRPLSGGEPIPRQLRPIFLDRDELSSGPDLVVQINNALRESRSLVVLCSPSARASAYVENEILEFQKLGRQEHIIAAIADPGPRGIVDDAFPRPLQGGREPLAADFGRDGFRNAKIKIIAGILGVGFDELKRRDRIRARWRLAWVSASTLLVALAYILLADMGAPFLFASTIQRWLDGRELSVSRHAPSESTLMAKISRLRSQVIPYELKEIGGELAFTPDGHVGGTWGLGQMVSAIAAAPEATAADLAQAKDRIDFIFNAGRPTEAHGVAYGWLWYKLGNPQAEAALWPIIALSVLLARPGAVSPGERSRFADHLHYAQRAASLYYTAGGGWDHLPNQQPPEPYALYTTLVALEAMLAVHKAGEPWPDNAGRDRLPEMIRATSAYLIRTYDNREEWHNQHGWHGTQEGEDITPHASLTLLAYSLLLTAGRAEPQLVQLPSYILSDIASRVINLASPEIGAYATDEDHLRTEFITPDGKKAPGYYDWAIPRVAYAIACATAWMNHLRGTHAQNADVVAVRRVLSQLVDQAEQVTKERRIFYRAEILYRLDLIR